MGTVRLISVLSPQMAEWIDKRFDEKGEGDRQRKALQELLTSWDARVVVDGKARDWLGDLYDWIKQQNDGIDEIERWNWVGGLLFEEAPTWPAPDDRDRPPPEDRFFPAPEIDPLPVILESLDGIPEELQLVVIFNPNSSWQHAVANLLRVLASRCVLEPLGIETAVDLQSLPIPYDANRSEHALPIAERVAAFAPDAFFGDDGSLRVYVNWRAGALPAKSPLLELAEYFDVPVVNRAGWRLVTTTHAGAARSSARLHQHYADIVAANWRLQAKGFGDRRPEVTASLRDAGLGVFMSTGQGDVGPSRSLTVLRDRHKRQSGELTSACADMLRRWSGDPAQPNATRLDALVDHWQSQELWTMNHVLEMVLHDEVHSQAVDRNLSLMCLPLLESELLTPQDVYYLALTAWLHDTGHASAVVGNRRIWTDPIDVRDFHGLLTDLRLGQEGQAFGLEPDEQAAVGLLAAHHQGWTCSGLGFSQPPPRLAVQNVTPPIRFKDDLRLRNRPLGQGNQLEYVRMWRLLALFRVADAADVGQHRVPHQATQASAATRHLQIYLTRLEDTLRAMGSPNAVVEVAWTLLDHHQARPAYTATNLQGQEAELSLWLRDLGVRFEAAIDAVPDISRQAANLLKDAKEYFDYVQRQALYFAHHDHVRAVWPVVRQEGKSSYFLTPLVEALDDMVSDEVLDRVTADIRREFGQDKDGKQGTTSKDDLKQGVGQALQTLHITVNPARVWTWK